MQGATGEPSAGFAAREYRASCLDCGRGGWKSAPFALLAKGAVFSLRVATSRNSNAVAFLHKIV